MDAKKAVALAKTHVAHLFEGEGLVNLGLEEVEYDEGHHQWRVTVGFSRDWQMSPLAVVIRQGGGRTYKVVTLTEDGQPLSVKNRETADAS